MRGKACFVLFLYCIYRITPAYAGKSFFISQKFGKLEDHPCVCGEKLVVFFSFTVFIGSPLRMRGKVANSRIICGLHRITPAYAGKRLKRSRKIVLFKSTVNHFHLVCNKPDTANDNLQWLGAAAWF